MIRLLFSRQWWWLTLLVIAAVAVMARLGLWQLDRLEQRRAFNARVQAQLDAPPIHLGAGTLGADLYNMEYRTVIVTGRYEHDQEVALRNQTWNNQLGVHLLTPLVISGTEQAVLVDRGWIPFDVAPGDWDEYAEPGTVEVVGVIRRSTSTPRFFASLFDPEPPPGETRRVFARANLDRIAAQVALPLLPVYIQQSPSRAWTGLPHRGEPRLELTEGSHLGYAIQWFVMAFVLAVGYPAFVRQHSLPARPTRKPVESGADS